MDAFLKKYKWWIFIIAAFLIVRAVIFVTFWDASADRGGWNNFYGNAQPAAFVLAQNFHDLCDWHPPLYYFLTSLLLFIFHSQWAIYAAQMLLAALSLFIFYKSAELFFLEKISYLATFLFAIEPLWAWHNWLLVSENLAIPLFLAFTYFFLKFLKHEMRMDIAIAGVFLGLATLTRPNTILLSIFLSIIALLFFKMNLRKLFMSLFVFNLIFFAVLSPWFIRNYLIYNRVTLANITSTNIYFYNLPPLIAWQKGISYASAYKEVKSRAYLDLGENVGDQGDCAVFTKDELNRQLDYFESESKKYIISNWKDYTKMHLLKATPFFLQSGYFDMFSAYTGNYSKPDITSAVLKGSIMEIKIFLFNINTKLVIYLFGLAFWGLCSLALFASLVYSFFKDRDRFLFFIIAASVVLYSALLISPFVLARYRLPLYIFFFLPASYLLAKIFSWSRLKSDEEY